MKNCGRSRESIKSSDEWKVIKRCVAKCLFSSEEKSREKDKQTHHYHPLALKVLGSQLGSISGEVSRWVECLGELKADKFNMFKDKVRPIFSVLGRGYGALEQEEQDIFLDLAVLMVTKSRSGRFRWGWLCMIHRKTEVEMNASISPPYSQP